MAIVFRAVDFLPILDRENTTFAYIIKPFLADVIYDDDKERFQRECSDLLNVIPKFAWKLMNNKKMDMMPILRPLMLHAPRYKHRGFREENEIRLVLYPESGGTRMRMRRENIQRDSFLSPKQVLAYRRNGLQEVLYVTFNQLDSAIKLPIERVIIGPHPQQAAVADRVAKLLQQHGYKSKIGKSQTPYIEQQKAPPERG